MPYSSTGKAPQLVEAALASKVPFSAGQIILQNNGTVYYDLTSGSSIVDRIVLGSAEGGSGCVDIPTAVYTATYTDDNTIAQDVIDMPIFLTSGAVASSSSQATPSTINATYRVPFTKKLQSGGDDEQGYCILIQTLRYKLNSVNPALPYIDQILVFPTSHGSSKLLQRQVVIAGEDTSWNNILDSSEIVVPDEFAGLKVITREEMDDPTYNMDKLCYIPEYSILTSFVSEYNVSGTTVTPSHTKDVTIPLNNCLVFRTTREDVIFGENTIRNYGRYIFTEEPDGSWKFVPGVSSDYAYLNFGSTAPKGARVTFLCKTEAAPATEDHNFSVKFNDTQSFFTYITTNYERVTVTLSADATSIYFKLTDGETFYIRDFEVLESANEQILQPLEPSQKHRSYYRTITDNVFSDWQVFDSSGDEFITYNINVVGDAGADSDNVFEFTPPTLVTTRVVLSNINTLSVRDIDCRAYTFMVTVSTTSATRSTAIKLPAGWLVEDGVIPAFTAGGSNYKFDIRRMKIGALSKRTVAKIHRYTTSAAAVSGDTVVYDTNFSEI